MAEPTNDGAAHEALRGAVELQKLGCEMLGSPIYGALLERMTADVAQRGICWEVMRGDWTEPMSEAVPLRLLGGVHRLVLNGHAPDLAPYYPSVGGAAGDDDQMWEAFVAAVAEHAVALRAAMPQPVQTNEVARSLALAGGFLHIVAETGMPLRLLELGTSAGLNLRWDRYHYQRRDGDDEWGDSSSALHLAGEYPLGWPLQGDVDVIERRGCDLNPIDPTTPEGEIALLSFVWPDQTERFERLRAAIAVAHDVPAQLDRRSAPAWLDDTLAVGHEGVTTVVYHSIFRQYLSADDQAGIEQRIVAAGERATEAAPVAWLRLEPGEYVARADIDVTIWPGGTTSALGRAGYHGPPVEWGATR